MSGPPLVFLDANILFSAALGGPAFQLLLDLARDGTVLLTTSNACMIEAATNLERKRPDRREALSPILAALDVEPDAEADEHLDWAQGLVTCSQPHGARAQTCS